MEQEATQEVMLRLVNVGSGLVIVNVWLVDVPPPGEGFVTVTVAVPVLVISTAGILAASETLLM